MEKKRGRIKASPELFAAVCGLIDPLSLFIYPITVRCCGVSKKGAFMAIGDWIEVIPVSINLMPACQHGSQESVGNRIQVVDFSV